MSPQQLTANQANAQLSTGPKTEAGRRRSSLNSFKHGVTGKIHIATPEDSAAFETHCRTYRDALAPAGVIELELAQEIAEDKWRLKRIRSIENSIFAQGLDELPAELATGHATGHAEIDAALSEGQTWIAHSRQLQLLTLYESRIRRAIEKNTAGFRALQAERKQAHAIAQQEAILLIREAQSEGKTYDPASDFLPAESHGGFVFSTSEIDRILSRRSRLERAQSHPNRQPQFAGKAA
jgi:hypothetical protein